MGAVKLQYFGAQERMAITGERAGRSSGFALVPQEALLLKILGVWIFILVYVGWFGWTDGHQIATVGIVVNINLLFFYAAPLQTIMTVVSEKNSESIHRPLMWMNWLNTSFWVLYGLVARDDPVIYGPNAVGLLFGIIQGALCCIYPIRMDPDVDIDPLLLETNAVEAGAAGEADGVVQTTELI